MSDFTEKTRLNLNTPPRPGRARRPDRRGTAVVELALVAPIFFALVFGIIQFGRIVMVQQILTNAAREAARMGVIEGANFSAIQAQVQTDLASMSVPNATVTLTELSGSGGSGDRVQAVITVDVSNITWTPGSYFKNFAPLTTLSANCTMRKESVQ